MKKWWFAPAVAAAVGALTAIVAVVVLVQVLGF
jgi:hypothetical protein